VASWLQYTGLDIRTQIEIARKGERGDRLNQTTANNRLAQIADLWRGDGNGFLVLRVRWMRLAGGAREGKARGDRDPLLLSLPNKVGGRHKIR
jgi:hypothetical protein